jgi:hypothetical protein
MSEEDDNAAGDVVDPSRLSRRARVIQFIEAAGLQINDVTDVLRRAPITLEDCVTDEHRDLVVDLKAADCSDEDVARFMRISKERCQRLFEWELANGERLRTVQHLRALNTNAIALGDTSAILGYLKMQPKLKWGTKHKNEEVEAPPDPEDAQIQRQQNEAFIAGITAGLSIDTTKFKAAKERTPTTVAKDKPKRVVYDGVVKKAKGE